MNALVSLDSILEPEQALTATSLFGSGQVETILAAIEKDVRAELFDIETEEGRERIKSVAYKIARSKTTLDEIGKEHVAHIKAQSTAIDKERKSLRDRLDALKDEVRGPLTDWENREPARVSEHEDALVWLAQCDRFATSPTAAMIRAQALDVSALSHRDWQEFKERGDIAVIEAHAKLFALLLTAEQAERDAAELAELRRLKAERDEADAQAAWQKAENARMEKAAEQQAARDAVRAEQEKAREIARAEQAERDKAAAAAKAVEDERKRVAAAKAAADAAAAKREANKKHRAKINSEITLALSEVLTGNADEAATLIEAIAAGKIPHVSIVY